MTDSHLPTRAVHPSPTYVGPTPDEPGWEPIAALLKSAYRDSGFAGGVSQVPLDRMVHDMMSARRAEEQVAELRRCGDLTGKRILEVGSGCGSLLVYGRVAHGLDIHGIEPGSQSDFSTTMAVCRRLLDHHGLSHDVVREATGEAIPHPDDSFDIVYSSNVLEHVGDPAAVLAESIRVLKPGGALCFVVPNYGSWWEGHYGVLWLPHMPAWLAKLYVRALGRDPSYVDTLNLVSHGQMERWLAPHRDRIENLDWGWSVFEYRLTTLDFSEWAALSVTKRVARWIHKVGLLRPALWLARHLHWETPLILTLRKRPPADIPPQRQVSR